MGKIKWWLVLGIIVAGAAFAPHTTIHIWHNLQTFWHALDIRLS